MSVLKGEGKVPILFGVKSVVSGALTHETYLSRPDLTGEWPTILIVPSAWGMTSSAKDLARRLARQGMAAVVFDQYRGSLPDRDADRDEARSAARAVPRRRALRDAQDLVRYIENPAGFWSSAEDGFAVLGVGDGGSVAAQLAASTGAALVLVASAPEPEELAAVTGPVLGLAGKDDDEVSADQVAALRSAAPHGEWVLYEGVGHDFHDDYLAGFDQQAFQDAVERIAAFAEKHLPPTR